MQHENNPTNTLSFHCRNPIYMCPKCSKAENCNDLLNILRMFQVEEIEDIFDYSANFPFLKKRVFKVDPRNKMNDLSSNEWLSFTRTAMSAKFPQYLCHELRRKHPEYKSPHLFGQLISFFTKKDDLLLDPFAGTGSALIAASVLGRDAIGFETESEWISIYNEICKRESIEPHKMVHGDCTKLFDHVPACSVDFIVIDPPSPIKSGAKAMNSDVVQTIDTFFRFINIVMQNCCKCLKKKRYMAVFTRNFYHKGRYLFLSPQYAISAEKAGFILKGEKIWENTSEKLRPYGYPHSYVPNIVHYDILIFQKREDSE